MPLSMKIQPINAHSQEIAARPVVKSRLKRLFRISIAGDKDEPPPGAEFEPSSMCLAKMVQNFIEESNEKPQSSAVRCGRNRCNCFNGNGSDSSDGESETVTSADVCDFLKSLVLCATVNERNVLADTARIVDKNKACKRNDEMRKIVTDALIGLGYNAAICKSKWDKHASFPAGEYEYVDVIVDGERLIIDIDFTSEFEIARSTKAYKSILQTLPHIFVGKPDRLSKIITIVSEAAKQSLKKKGMHFPPWRKADYVKAKWLSSHTRFGPTPPPNPSVQTNSGPGSNHPSPGLSPSLGPGLVVERYPVSEPELSPSSTQSESVFAMSESSGEEDAGKKLVEIINPKVAKSGLKIVTGLDSVIVDHKP